MNYDDWWVDYLLTASIAYDFVREKNLGFLAQWKFFGIDFVHSFCILLYITFIHNSI